MAQEMQSSRYSIFVMVDKQYLVENRDARWKGQEKGKGKNSLVM